MGLIYFIKYFILKNLNYHPDPPGMKVRVTQQVKNHDQLRFLPKVKIIQNAAAAAKSPQSCLTLYDPVDGSPPGSLGFSRQETGVGCHFLLDREGNGNSTLVGDVPWM